MFIILGARRLGAYEFSHKEEIKKGGKDGGGRERRKEGGKEEGSKMVEISILSPQNNPL